MLTQAARGVKPAVATPGALRVQQLFEEYFARLGQPTEVIDIVSGTDGATSRAAGMAAAIEARPVP